MVADDECSIAATVGTILRNAGYEVEVYVNGATARDQTPGPDLAIIDPVLPGLNGTELAINLVRRFPACRILLFSARAVVGCSQVEAVRRAGYQFPLLAKPVYPTELLERVAFEVGLPQAQAVA